MEPALAIFAPLLGKCFAATLAPQTVDRHCFASVYDGVHVRDTHVVTAKGKPVYSGESVYSFDGKGLQFTYVNSMGGVGHGTATVQSGVMSYDLSMKAKPAGAPQQFRGKWTVDAEGYDVADDGQPPHRFSLSR